MEQINDILKKISVEQLEKLTKKTSHTFYLRDVNYQKLKAISDECQLSPSKVLDEIINQLPDVDANNKIIAKIEVDENGTDE